LLAQPDTSSQADAQAATRSTAVAVTVLRAGRAVKLKSS
jgi:hypothetical protein